MILGNYLKKTVTEALKGYLRRANPVGRELLTIYNYVREERHFPFWYLKRILNRVLNDWEFRRRRTRLRSLPYILYIDPANVCNLRCPLCPTGQGIMPSQGKMPLETFYEIFDQLKDYVYKLHLYNWGEPLLYSNIYRMIYYASRFGVETVISTNLNVPMTSEIAAQVVESRLTRLVVSMDGATQNIYEKYRVRGNLDRVKANLQLLVEAKQRLRSRLPYIVVQCIAFSHNEHELPQLRKLVEQIGVDHFRIERAILDMSTVATQEVPQSLVESGEWLPAEQEFRRYEGNKWRYDPQACRFLWNTAVFRWDGEVFPCCVVYRDTDSFGNVQQGPFKKIWNNAKYQSARSLFGVSSPANTVSTCCNPCYANEGYKVVNR